MVLGCWPSAREGSRSEELMQLWGRKISEVLCLAAKEGRRWCTSDLGAVSMPGLTQAWVFATEEYLLKRAMQFYDAAVEKFLASMWAKPQKMGSFLFSKDEYESRSMNCNSLASLVKKRTKPEEDDDAAGGDCAAGESSAAEPDAKRHKASDACLKKAVELAKSVKLLHPSFQAPDSAPKTLRKLQEAGASENCLAIGLAMIEKAAQSPVGSVLVASATKKIKPDCIQVDGFPSRALNSDLMVTLAGKKPKLRLLLPAEVLSMKQWPADACNLSFLSSKACAQAVHDCFPFAGIAAAMFGIAAACNLPSQSQSK